MATRPGSSLVREAIEHLASFDRPSASEGERRAAEWIAGRLRALGARNVRIEEERAHGTYWWPWGLLNLEALLGAALAAAGRRLLGLSLVLEAVVLLVDDIDHRNRWFRRILPRHPTYNVVAEAGDPDAERTVVVVAHHDAAHGGLFFDTTAIALWARYFPEHHARAERWPRAVRLVVAGPVLIAAGIAAGSGRLRRLGTILSAGAIASMSDIGLRSVVPGANDNLTGVAAVLALAERLRAEPVAGLRVLLVSTGSEESNSEGMQAFVRRHLDALPRETTTFLVLDTVGSGLLAIAESEGFLVTRGYDEGLKALADRLAGEVGAAATRGLHISFATDAQIAVHAGYRTMCLGSVDELKLPANYHKPTDVPENVDFACVEGAVRLTEAMVREVAREAPLSAPR